MAQPVNPAARRNWAIFGIAALVIVMVAGVWKAKRQAPDEPTPQASTQSPAATLPAVPAAPDVNATQPTQTPPPTPSTPEDRITQAANEIAAKAQKAAMAKAKTPIDVATENAVKANAGYRAVSVIPKLDGDRPVADVTLMKGEDVKKVTQKLD